MLKDITLGQYMPGNTLVHRLDPRTKIILTILYIAIIFCVASPLFQDDSQRNQGVSDQCDSQRNNA